MDDVSRIELSIIIVSWNVKALLRKCLHSIEQSRGDLELEVIVVDNDSIDGSPEMLRTEFPWVRLNVQDENVGFPRANNIGIQSSQGHYLLLLNPDTEIRGDGLTVLFDYLEEHRQCGVAAAQLLNSDGTIQSSIRRFPSVATGFFESTWLESLAPRKLLDNYTYADAPRDKIINVDWVTGACMMVRRQVIEQVGLLDEDYFMYSEELDWCRRIRSNGWQITYVPEAKIVHHVGKSSEQAVAERHINFQRAKLRYFRKYHGAGAALAIRVVLLLNYLVQLFLELAKGLVGHKRDIRRQRVSAYWQVLKSGLPPAGY